MEKGTEIKYELNGFKVNNNHLDTPDNVPENIVSEIEKEVKEWLDNEGIESPTKYYEAKDSDGKIIFGSHVVFNRYEIALKTLGNIYTIYHIARASNWKNVIVSSPKIAFEHNNDEVLSIKNSVDFIDSDKMEHYKHLYYQLAEWEDH